MDLNSTIKLKQNYVEMYYNNIIVILSYIIIKYHSTFNNDKKGLGYIYDII